MSEADKKRRELYGKNRTKWIFAQSAIIIVVAIMVLISSIVYVQLEKTYYIEYKENGSIDYRVYLKDNEFFDEDYLNENQAYVSTLIGGIFADFTYDLYMDAENVNFDYTYRIDAELEIVDNYSKATIFNPIYNVKAEERGSHNSATPLRISEPVFFDYEEYNDLANRFIETYELENTTSNLYVRMYVDVMGDCTAIGVSTAEQYVAEMCIPLTNKTVNVEMTTSIPEENDKMIACERGVGKEAFLVSAVVLGVVDALLILILVAFVLLTRTVDTTYAGRVKKLVTSYKSYIQKINNLFDMSGYEIVRVNSFEEMLEIRDTIQAPVLMYENDDKTCSKFIIPTQNKLLYLYEIKVEGYTEPEIERKSVEPTTTVVAPNITNVVKPTIKVVVTPPTPAPTEPEPVVETVVEEPEIEVEAEPDAEPVVVAEVSVDEPEEEPALEEVAEEAEETVEEIVEEPVVAPIIETAPVAEEIPVAVEEPVVEESGVDAIDVVWPEKRDKTYRYDPDGENVSEGDVVLVPTRDVARDKEVVREAEVARGNYKVDPETLAHPLKKIIGVVRRKAEEVFTAMILPEEKTAKAEEPVENTAEENTEN